MAKTLKSLMQSNKVLKRAVVVLYESNTPSLELNNLVLKANKWSDSLQAEKYLYITEKSDLVLYTLGNRSKHLSKKYLEMCVPKDYKIKNDFPYLKDVIEDLQSNGITEAYFITPNKKLFKEELEPLKLLKNLHLANKVKPIIALKDKNPPKYILESVIPSLIKEEEFCQKLPKSLNESRTFSYQWVKLDDSIKIAAFKVFQEVASIQFNKVSENDWKAAFNLTSLIKMSDFKNQFLAPVVNTLVKIVSDFVIKESPRQLNFQYNSNSKEDSIAVNYLRNAISNLVRRQGYLVQLFSTGSSYQIVIKSKHMHEQQCFFNSLGYSREEMPQIKNKDRKDFCAYLNKNGVATYSTILNVCDIKPTQDEINPERLAKKMLDIETSESYAPEKSFIVSKEHRLLDGHHEWLSIQSLYPNSEISVTIADMGIEELIQLAHKYKKSYIKDLEGNIKKDK